MDEMEVIRLFLMDRDKRVEHQEKLIKKYNGLTLATVRINYPGIEKSHYVTDSIVKAICEEISIFYRKYIIFSEQYKNREGYIGHFIFNIEYQTVKKFLIEFEENHILGRCVDLDVYYLIENKEYGFDELRCISRRDLNLPPRKCFICNEEARLCSRIKRHSLEEIKRFFENKFYEYSNFIKVKEELAYEISQLALKSIITEVSTMPSFGLVSPTTSGAHNDMDYYTFIDSSFVIVPYLKDMAMTAYSYHNPVEIFDVIRRIGIDCEIAMFKATNGVNTHKGMIFLIGIVVTATMKVLYEKRSFYCVEEIIKSMCKNILSDFEDINLKDNLTHGEKLYKEYGFTGIRGEVKDGIPAVFRKVLPNFLKSSLKGNELYAHTLLELMAKVEDSTIVYRQSIIKLKEIQERSKQILSIGGFYSSTGIEAALEFEEKCIQEKVSPGGSADLLAIVIFLAEIYNKYFKENIFND